MFDTSRKIKNIEAMPKGDTLIVLWIKLLLLAGTVNDGGAIYITPSAPYTDEGLANELRRPLKIVSAALETFKTYDMIVYRDGILYIKNWEKYQNTDRLSEIREYNRIAKQKSREKQRASLDVSDNVNDNVNDKSMTLSMTSQRCQDIRKKKKEEDKEKELDISFKEREDSFLPADFFEKSDSMGIRRERLASVGLGLVIITDKQLKELYEKLSLVDFEHYVGVIRDCVNKGRKYTRKTHAQAILDMARADGKIITAREQSTFNTDDFFEAAVRASYRETQKYIEEE